MLRINLLPASVAQRRRTRLTIIGFAALLLVCIAAPLAIYASQKAHLSELTQQADTAEAGKKQTDALKAQAVSTLAKVKPIADKLKFVEDVHAYPRQWVALYNTLAETTPKSSFIYTEASVSGGTGGASGGAPGGIGGMGGAAGGAAGASGGATMTIKAYSPSLEEVGRYLQAMYQEPDFQTVAVDHVPGYPDNVRHLYYLNGVLVFADSGTSSNSSGGGSSPMGGMGGMNIPSPMGGMSPSPMGGMGGMGGQSSGGSGGSGGAPAGWSAGNLGPNAPGNLPPGVTAPPPQLTGGTASTPSGGGGPMGAPGGIGGQSGGQNSGGYSPAFLAIAGKGISPFAPPAVREKILQQALGHVVVKEVPKGFDLTVTATLKQPLTPPTLPGTAPSGPGGGGRPGAMPGMGMPGMGRPPAGPA